MAKKKTTVTLADTPADVGGTQVRVLPLPIDNVPAKVKQICDAMMLDSYRLAGTFEYADHVVLIFQ